MHMRGCLILFHMNLLRNLYFYYISKKNITVKYFSTKQNMRNPKTINIKLLSFECPNLLRKLLYEQKLTRRNRSLSENFRGTQDEKQRSFFNFHRH